MAELTIKTFNRSIHDIYLNGEVCEDMWSELVKKIKEIKCADDEVSENNTAHC